MLRGEQLWIDVEKKTGRNGEEKEKSGERTTRSEEGKEGDEGHHDCTIS